MTTCEACPATKECFFSSTDQKVQSTLGRHLVRNKYKKGQVLIYDGMKPHGVFVICEGRTKAFKADESGHQLVLRFDGPGSLVGSRALVSGVPYMKTIEVAEDSLIGFLDRDIFLTLIRMDQELALRLMRGLARQLGDAEDKALKMAFHGAHRRIAELLQVSRPGVVVRQNGTGRIVSLPRRQDLAEMAGLALETTIRTLKRMEANQVIRMKGRQITILDPQKLEALAAAA